jgi:hypothetical protein
MVSETLDLGPIYVKNTFIAKLSTNYGFIEIATQYIKTDNFTFEDSFIFKDQ